MGESIQQTNSSSNYFPFSGFHYETYLSTTTKTFILQYRRITAGATCTVRNAVLEALLGFKRAGADLIITYHALEAARWLEN